MDIDHAGGWTTRYQHLGVLTGKFPRQVVAGEQIGITKANDRRGTTCNPDTSFSHLHFGLLRQGQPFVINGLSIGGYTVHAGKTAYSGTWTRNSDGATVVRADANAACCLKNNQLDSGAPRGSLDKTASPKPGKIRVAGWAFDPDAKTKQLRIHLYIGGPSSDKTAEGHAFSADNIRNDIAKLGAGKRHGFDETYDTKKAGTVSVCVYAKGLSSKGKPARPDSLLGARCRKVKVQPVPPPEDGGGEVDPDVAPQAPTPEPTFSETSYEWPVGSGYQSFMGDFNRDGRVDVGLRRVSDGAFYWRLATDSGHSQTQYQWAAGDQYQSFMGDFNGDGQVDVGLRRTTDGTFYWRLGPDFAQSSYQWAVGDQYQSFMGDFNGDGQVDIGLRRTTDGTFYWRLGGSLGFAQTSYEWPVGSGYHSFLGDFNRDGYVDVGLRRVSDGAFYWRLGSASGFNSQTRYQWAAGDQYQSFMGDFNGDGRLDLGLRRTIDPTTFYWRLGSS